MPAKKKSGRISVTTQEEKANTEEKSHLHVNEPTSKETIVVGNNTTANLNSLQTMEDNTELRNLVVRRSTRIQQTASRVGVQVAKPVVKQVNVVEKDKEVAPHRSRVSVSPILTDQNLEDGSHEQDDATPSRKDMNLEDKIDYLVESVDEFKAQGLGQAPEMSNYTSDLNYKSLYLDSQKKIEHLVEENFELVKKLEFARGKVAAYEMMKDAMNGANEVLFARAMEAAVSVEPKKKNAKKRKG